MPLGFVIKRADVIVGLMASIEPITGLAEAGVQGVPRETQYLALHLVKTMFISERFGVRYLCAHPIFRTQ